MLRTRRLSPAASRAVFLLAIPLIAQDQAVPLKNWPSPLYWQASPARQSVRKPEVEFMAVSPHPASAATNTAPLVFVGTSPCRILDTRGSLGSFGGPMLSGGSTRTVPVPTHPTCGIPLNALAYSFNVTVVPMGALGYLAIWPTGQAKPNVSTLNDSGGQILANAAIVPAGTSGSVNIYVTDATDVILDVNGYYMPQQTTVLSRSFAPGNRAVFSNVTLSGTSSHYAPSASIAFSTNYSAPAACGSCAVVVGFISSLGSASGVTCLNGGALTAGDGTWSAILTAPATPGVYSLTVGSASGYTCSSAVGNFPAIGLGNTIDIASISIY